MRLVFEYQGQFVHRGGFGLAVWPMCVLPALWLWAALVRSRWTHRPDAADTRWVRLRRELLFGLVVILLMATLVVPYVPLLALALVLVTERQQPADAHLAASGDRPAPSRWVWPTVTISLGTLGVVLASLALVYRETLAVDYVFMGRRPREAAEILVQIAPVVLAAGWGLLWSGIGPLLSRKSQIAHRWSAATAYWVSALGLVVAVACLLLSMRYYGAIMFAAGFFHNGCTSSLFIAERLLPDWSLAAPWLMGAALVTAAFWGGVALRRGARWFASACILGAGGLLVAGCLALLWWQLGTRLGGERIYPGHVLSTLVVGARAQDPTIGAQRARLVVLSVRFPESNSCTAIDRHPDDGHLLWDISLWGGWLQLSMCSSSSHRLSKTRSASADTYRALETWVNKHVPEPGQPSSFRCRIGSPSPYAAAFVLYAHGRTPVSQLSPVLRTLGGRGYRNFQLLVQRSDLRLAAVPFTLGPGPAPGSFGPHTTLPSGPVYVRGRLAHKQGYEVLVSGRPVCQKGAQPNDFCLVSARGAIDAKLGRRIGRRLLRLLKRNGRPSSQKERRVRLDVRARIAVADLVRLLDGVLNRPNGEHQHTGCRLVPDANSKGWRPAPGSQDTCLFHTVELRLAPILSGGAPR